MAKGGRVVGFMPNDGTKSEAGPQPLPDHVVTQFFRKTRPCRYWPNCAKGDKCAWAHGETDLRAGFDFTKSKLCAGWRDGRCRLDPSKCKFAHGPHELRQIANKPTDEQELQPPTKQPLEDIPAPPGLADPTLEDTTSFAWQPARQRSPSKFMSSQDSLSSSSGGYQEQHLFRWESDSGSTAGSSWGFANFDSPSAAPLEAPSMGAPGLFLGELSGNINNINNNVSSNSSSKSNSVKLSPSIASSPYPAQLPLPPLAPPRAPFNMNLTDYAAKIEPTEPSYAASVPGSFLNVMAPEASELELRMLFAKAGLTSGSDPVWNEPSYNMQGRVDEPAPRYVSLPTLN